MNFPKSDMKLVGHIDVSYLNKPKSRSILGGHFLMSDIYPFPPNNGVMLMISKIIKLVMSFAADAELSALFINAR